MSKADSKVLKFTIRSRLGGRVRRPTVPVGPSLTRQAEAASCDINTILAKYAKTGLLEHVNRFQGDYADVSPFPDFHTAQNMVLRAHDAFSSLPSGLRNHFDNDPGKFMDFVNDPKNSEEMVKMGLKSSDSLPSSPAEPLRKARRDAQEPGEGDEVEAQPPKGKGA